MHDDDEKYYIFLPMDAHPVLSSDCVRASEADIKQFLRANCREERLVLERSFYCPLNTGLRFSLKARMPSV